MSSRYSTSFRALGSQINIWLESDQAGAAHLAETPHWIEAYEAVLSRFRPNSELSQLNQRLHEWVKVSDILWQNIALAWEACDITEGLCNPLVLPALLAAGYDRSFTEIDPASAEQMESSGKKIDIPSWHQLKFDGKNQQVKLPGSIDLGGSAKGWIGMQIADQLVEYGSCLVDLGGDIVARQNKQYPADWKVQLYDPFNPDSPISLVSLPEGTIATSGIEYRHWGKNQHHLIDPRTGHPVQNDVLSATVIHPDAVYAEAYAKAVLIDGSLSGLSWLMQETHAAGLVITKDSRVLATSNMQSYMLEGV